MANRFFNPVPQFQDSSSIPYAGGFLNFYVTGTSTRTNTYSDTTLATANANPIELNSAGAVPDDIFLDPSVVYKVVLTDSAGVTIWTRDPVVDPAANASAAFQVFNGNPNGGVAGFAGAVGGAGASVIYDIANDLIWVCTTTGTVSTAVWTQQGATLSGAVTYSGIITPTTLAADANDYNPASLSTSSIIRQNASGNVTITGLAGGAAGRLITIQNIATGFNIILRSESSASTAANRFGTDGDILIRPKQSVELWYDATSSRWRHKGSASNAPNGDPGGRLTISTGEPVITSDVTAAATVYYAPYRHNYARLYDGAAWYTVQFSELSQALSDATKSPLAAAVDSVYDMFLWNDAGTLRCTRGPAWSSATSRGTGAGTTELERVDGVWVNKVAITNGPTAQAGLYVGTIATNGSTQMAVMLYPTAAAGGTNNRIDVWNAYNRITVSSTCRDSVNSWDYSLATWRPANNDEGGAGTNTNSRITFVAGLNEEAIAATYNVHFSATGGDYIASGIGVDSTTAFSGSPGVTPMNGDLSSATAHYAGMTGLGRHFIQALEYSVAAGTTTWYGDNNVPLVMQSTLQIQTRY